MKPHYILIYFFFISTVSQAQSVTAKTYPYQAYDSLSPYVNSGIYFGKPTSLYLKTEVDNHPFFTTREYQLGNVVYRGQPYHGVLLRFDTVKQEIQMKPPVSEDLLPITLFSELIDSFDINERHFLKRMEDDGQISFYENYMANTLFQVLFSHRKIARESSSGGGEGSYSFSYSQTCYILLNSNLHEIKSEKDVTRLFPEYQDTLKELFAKQPRKRKGKLNTCLKVLNEWHLQQQKNRVQ